jgi:glycosyltransferase involved in cell wall biosynthesis
LFFGRIDSYKGLDLLIEALEDLYAQGIDKFHLSIKGQGSFWPECEKAIKHQFLFDPDIRFIRDEEIPDLFSSCHFLVLPYRDTTQSGPMMIAIRYGLPVIAPKFPSFTEYCNEGNSILYETGELAKALKQCAAMDEITYHSLAKNWDSVRAHCSSAAIASHYISFFHEII